MESSSSIVSVFLYKGQKRLDVPIPTPMTAEEVIIFVAKYLEFRPVSLHLFAIRTVHKNTTSWLPLNYKFTTTKSYQAEFRMRFKLPSLSSLSRLDVNAFDYVFHQIRHDLLHGLIQEFCQDEYKPQALGLCATDMIRAILEEGRSREEVLKNYQQYIPRSIYKQHFLFLKKKLHDHIYKMLPVDTPPQSVSLKYIKEQYVSHAEDISPTYLTEEFTAMAFKVDEYPTTIRVDPLNKDIPGISMAYVGKLNWEHLCTIEELCFISMREDCTVEISRKNGIPIVFKFKSLDVANSFVALLDGYYRLTEKWTFNLCKDVFTPSLTKLRTLKCHGPIGLRFSYQKLSTHPSTKKGWFILRQSSSNFDEYAIDYIMENKNRPQSREVKIMDNGKLRLEKQAQEFKTISELISHFISNPMPDFCIMECLPPSEYDRSPLLLCRSPLGLEEVHKVCSTGIDGGGGPAPQVITPRALQVYRGKKFEYEGKLCKVIKAMWRQNHVTTVNVAIKLLKKEYEESHTKDLLEVASQCVLWQCESLVNLKGVVLGNPQALVLDWMPYGPLDLYLVEHSLHVNTTELIEAGSHIAKALWFLEDHGIVHGNIRCHNVLVFDHSDNGLSVKLSDPSISETSPKDIHWIPPEFFEIPGLSKKFVTADVWAVGTTLWEVFSYGAKPPGDLSDSAYKTKYLSGWRLPLPEKCPSAIMRIISECWCPIPDTRKQPQAIVRDIHQILYQLIGSKRVHSYSLVSPALSEAGTGTSNSSTDLDACDNFNWTTFGSDPIQMESLSDGTLSTFIHEVSIHTGSHHSRNTQATWLDANGSPSPDLISGFSDYTNGSIGTVYSMSSAVGIYEFRNNQVTLGRMIGQGFYGAVFLGEIVRTDGSKEHIAIKKLKEKRESLDTAALDFRRELEILQKLCHPNIVEVKGVVYDPDLLLIMEFLPMGSLLDYFKISYGRRPDSRQLLKFAQDVAEGMDYLSANNIVHRDLAARNLLVANDDLVKISDFGLARVTDNDKCYTLRTRRHFPIKWYPPESIEFGKFSEQTDIWSYGVTVYEIFSYGADPILPGLTATDLGGETDNVSLEETLHTLKTGIRLPCPESCPQSVYTELMLPCWNINPLNRPTFRSLLGLIQRVETNLF